MFKPRPTVFVVDDDPQMREAIELLVRSAKMEARAFASAEQFLESYVEDTDTPQCLVLDLRMAGMDGLQLQAKLHKEKLSLPVIMITGDGDVPTAVEAMRAGAIDFLQKPFSRDTLLGKIEFALKQDKQHLNELAEKDEFHRRLNELTDRENEILTMLIAGDNSKKISSQLGISLKTVLKHRLRGLQKMSVQTPIELVHLAYRYKSVDEESDQTKGEQLRSLDR